MVYQRSAVEALPAYVQGKSIPDAIKLSSNENPYPPLESVAEVVRECATSFHLYPDMSAAGLVARLAERWNVRPEEVAVGSGSVEVASQLIHASAGEGDEVMFAWRSFEAYPILVQVAGATPVPVPLTADDRHDLDAMVAAITDRTRLIFICTPNNPTGSVVTRAEMQNFLDRVPKEVLVVIDEAYSHFDDDPESVDGLEFFRSHPNVAVLHTFSKAYGLAGLRVGYAIAPERVATNLRRVAVPFGVSTLAQAAAIASLDAESELQERVDVILGERTRVVAKLRDSGWQLHDSLGNFVWLRTGSATAEVDAILREHGVVARAFLGDGIRVTIGSPEMNDRFLAAIGNTAPAA
ncbi:histidinol-phosphate transaminase [Leucobacter insecticola]|uniref:Aromatic amino acid aminotransferase n=1 Tax=Leucobacter insecticola TaxID=2714934 RepID=A0A6G8FG34_9MICO|nr:histidinol-phosphate transaminase [Leucobacter insecticola]QIM15476.1 histidinol-phosphate transaminase [Leucobacter insecticola]